MNAFALTFVRQRRKLLLTDELSHSSRGGDVAGRERCQTCCIDVSDFTLDRDFLTVFIHEEHNPRRRVHAEPGQHSFDLVILILSEQDRRVCHWYSFLEVYLREGRDKRRAITAAVKTAC